MIAALKTEAARGSLGIAKFYEERKKWSGALVYYNEVLVQDPDSPYAETARVKINELKQRIGDTSETPVRPAPVTNAAPEAVSAPATAPAAAPESKPAEIPPQVIQ
jgi:hypothetical protein